MDLAEVHKHHHGRLASFEHRMAAWRAPLRGVDLTAPHPAINKLAEREQPRDEPFNSATFCLPSPSTFLHPLSRSYFLRFHLPLSDHSLFFKRNPCTLSAIQHVRFHSVPQQDSVLALRGLSRTNGRQRSSELFRIFLVSFNRLLLWSRKSRRL